jgi:nucleotide-binding universal stress UspA family protein
VAQRLSARLPPNSAQFAARGRGASFARPRSTMLPQTILVPTDFGEPSEAALDYAVELAKALGAEIVILHAFEIPAMSFPDGAIVATAEMTSRILEGAQVGLDKQVTRYASSGVSVRGIVKQNDPWHAVLTTAEEIGADLVCMGTHGRRGLPRAILGSVAEKVVRTCTMPVLVVHAHHDDKHVPGPKRDVTGADVPAGRH